MVPRLTEHQNRAKRVHLSLVSGGAPSMQVVNEGKCHRLHIPILLEEIQQEACSVRKRQGKLIVILEKRDAGKLWCARGPWGGASDDVGCVSCRPSVTCPTRYELLRIGTSCARRKASATRSIARLCPIRARSSSSRCDPSRYSLHDIQLSNQTPVTLSI